MQKPFASDRNRPRSRLMGVARLLTFPALAVFLLPAPAAAYIDPVSGSVLIQIVAAAVLAGVATVSRARHWVVSLFRGRGGQDREDAG
jgi:hypothetical protein